MARNAAVSTFIFLILISVAGPTGAAAAPEEPRAVTLRTNTMGAWASLTLVTADSAAVADLARDALLVFHRVDSLMTNWTDTSEVARLNREAAGGPTPDGTRSGCRPETAERIGRESGGAFDISIEPLVRLWGFLGEPRGVPSAREIDAVKSAWAGAMCCWTTRPARWP